MVAAALSGGRDRPRLCCGYGDPPRSGRRDPVSRVRRPPRTHPTDAPPPEAPHRPGWVPRRDLAEPGPDPAGGPGTAGGAGAADGPDPASERPARPAWALPAALAAMAVVYPAAFQFRVVPFWSAMVAFSAFSWWAAWHPYLRRRLRPSR